MKNAKRGREEPWFVTRAASPCRSLPKAEPERWGSAPTGAAPLRAPQRPRSERGCARGQRCGRGRSQRCALPSAFPTKQTESFRFKPPERSKTARISEPHAPFSPINSDEKWFRSARIKAKERSSKRTAERRQGGSGRFCAVRVGLSPAPIPAQERTSPRVYSMRSGDGDGAGAALGRFSPISPEKKKKKKNCIGKIENAAPLCPSGLRNKPTK